MCEVNTIHPAGNIIVPQVSGHFAKSQAQGGAGRKVRMHQPLGTMNVHNRAIITSAKEVLFYTTFIRLLVCYY